MPSNRPTNKSRYQELWKLSSHLAGEASTEILKRIENTVIGDIAFKSGKLTFIQSVHWLMHQALKAQGYEWEVRGAGELKIGLWRRKFREVKAGEPPRRMVLVPGFGDTPMSWMIVLQSVMPILRKRVDELILLDFPGSTGFLSRERAFPSMDLMMSSLFDLFDWLKPNIILGHSLGGCLTTHYAGLCGKGERPLGNRKVWAGPETIIVANPSGLPESDQAREEFKGRLRDFVSGGFDAWRKYVFHKEPMWVDFVRSEFDRFITSDEIASFMDSIRDDHSVDLSVPNIKAKTWVIWGENDNLVHVAEAYEWLKQFNPENPDMHVVILKGVSHSLQVENPAVTAAALGQILRDKAPHAAGKRWWKVIKRGDYKPESKT